MELTLPTTHLELDEEACENKVDLSWFSAVINL